MDPLSLIALIAATVWIVVLSLVVLLLVRQVALLDVKLQRGASRATPREGLMIGREIPASVAGELPEMRNGVVYLLLMSAICGPCREVAPELRRLRIEEAVVALVPGGGDAVSGLVSLLPTWVRVIVDPTATEMAKQLQIDTTPFALEVEFGMITGKVFIHEARDLMHLVEARRFGARKLGREAMEVATSVSTKSAN